MDVVKRRVADGRVNSNRFFSMYALLPLDDPHKTQYALKNAYGLMCLGLLFWDKMIVVNIWHIVKVDSLHQSHYTTLEDIRKSTNVTA